LRKEWNSDIGLLRWGRSRRAARQAREAAGHNIHADGARAADAEYAKRGERFRRAGELHSASDGSGATGPNSNAARRLLAHQRLDANDPNFKLAQSKVSH